MKFNPNISPVDVIKKGAFGRTYYRDNLFRSYWLIL